MGHGFLQLKKKTSKNPNFTLMYILRAKSTRKEVKTNVPSDHYTKFKDISGCGTQEDLSRFTISLNRKLLATKTFTT